MSVALSLTHLRVDLIARSQVRLGGYQTGERLRNCLANVRLRATCVENPRRAKPDPEHAVHYPVWGRSVRVTPLGKGVSSPTKGVGSKPPKPSKSKLSVKGNSLESIIAKDADDIVKQNYETAIVYDSNGNVILRKDGCASQVSFTAAEEK